jgi:hypothetical protein
MATSIPNLWPDDIANSNLRSPVAILREQARFLAEKTRHLLEGFVRTKVLANNQLSHFFYIEAPKLDGYQFHLFTIEHQTDFYPVKIFSDSDHYVIAKSEEELMKRLSDLLSSEKTKKVIHALIAQSQS